MLHRNAICEGFRAYAIEYGMLLVLVRAARMKFLEAMAVARSCAAGTPRRQLSTPEQPHATFARCRSASPDAASTAERRCTFPRGALSSHAAGSSFSSSSSLHSVAHVELDALSSHAVGHHRPPHRRRGKGPATTR
jgi:hypothetical protein